MSAERARLAAGLLAAVGMIGAAVVAVVATRDHAAPPAPPTKVRPSRDKAIVDALIQTYYNGEGGYLSGFGPDVIVHQLIDEYPEYVAPHPRISVGMPMIEADYDRRTIRRFIRYHLDRITRCYDNRLRDRAGISGEIMVHFLITRTGAVNSVSGAGVDGELADCVAHVTGGIVFPKPADLVQVVLPLTFFPTSTEQPRPQSFPG